MKNHLIIITYFLVLNTLFSQNIENLPLYQKVLPGSDLLNISKVDLTEKEYVKTRGKMIYKLDEVSSTMGIQYKLFIDFNVNNRSAPDTVYFNFEDLHFEKRYFYNAWGKYEGNLLFENNKLTGHLSPVGNDSQLKEPLIYNKKFTHGSFEPATLNYILGALPLSIGFTASLPMLDLNNGSSIIWANIEVVGKETLKLNGKKYNAFKIISKGSRDKTFWIDTNRFIMLKMKNKGVFGTWKLKE